MNSLRTDADPLALACHLRHGDRGRVARVHSVLRDLLTMTKAHEPKPSLQISCAVRLTSQRELAAAGPVPNGLLSAAGRHLIAQFELPNGATVTPRVPPRSYAKEVREAFDLWSRHIEELVAERLRLGERYLVASCGSPLPTDDQRSRLTRFNSSCANSIRHAVTQNSRDLAARSRQIFACARWTAAAS
jgi:hypothetical protein